MTLLARLTRTAIHGARVALAPVRAALYVPVAHSTQAEDVRVATETARSLARLSLMVEDIDDDIRGRAVNALDDIDAGLRQLAACLDPSNVPRKIEEGSGR